MKIRALVVGTGGFGRYHLRRMLACSKNTTIVGLIETSEEQREKTRQLFAEMKAPCPPFHETIRDFLKAGGKADAAVIVTPHRYHLEHALACLRAGMDVLMEKPMVLDVREARRLIRERDRLGRMLVVAFPSSLSPALRRAREMIETGRIGRVSAISAAVHQRWKQATAGLWRQVPEISGGGFLFDTGSHLVNAMLELGGDEVSEVHAFMDHAGTPVEITSAIAGRFRNGVLFSICAAGDSILCDSQLRVYGDRGILETGAWGEWLKIRTEQAPKWKDVPCPARRSPWEIFLAVRAGKMPNPCPAEVGLRFARFMEKVNRSVSPTPATRRGRARK